MHVSRSVHAAGGELLAVGPPHPRRLPDPPPPHTHALLQYWKGDHIISVTQKIVEEHLKTVATQKNIEIDTSRLHWTPFGGGGPMKK